MPREDSGFLFDTATGRRVYRSAIERLLYRRLGSIGRWAAELAGVALIAGAGWTVHEGIALTLVGSYLVILANVSSK